MKSKKINLAIFVSGSGTHLKRMVNDILENNYTFEKFTINKLLIFSDRDNIEAIRFTKEKKLDYYIADYKNLKRAQAEANIIEVIKKNKINFVVLAGFMKRLNTKFLNDYFDYTKSYKTMVNVHPSLLPKYKGLHVVERAYENKEKYFGFTVHYVVPAIDSGEIVFQKKYLIDYSKTPDENKEILKVHENKHYWLVVKKLLSTNF